MERQGPRVDASNIAAAVDGELRRLQTDHLDLLQIHWPDRYVPTFGAHQYRPEVNNPPATSSVHVGSCRRFLRGSRWMKWTTHSSRILYISPPPSA